MKRGEASALLKEKLYKLLYFVCALTVALSVMPQPVFADAISGKTASTYAYILNDFMERCSTVTYENSAQYFDNADGLNLNGVYYSDVVDFDGSGNPYLVVFVLSSAERSAQARIWRYDAEADMPVETANLSKSYADLPPDSTGEFYLGKSGAKRYIAYKEHSGGTLVKNEYYTVIKGDAFMYVNAPTNVEDSGIMSFNSVHFHSGIDISGYNRQLDDFFMRLKNASADSVTLKDMADDLRTEDEEKIEKTLSKAVCWRDFDINSFSSMTEYTEALSQTTEGDRFYLITNMYNLGDELYYIRFSTDRSFYNYALVRRSDDAPNGYQLLKVRTDCIPLSDKELAQVKDEYSRCTLLMKKAHGHLKKVSSCAPLTERLNLPHIDVEKRLPVSWRFPSALIGGGLGLGLTVWLWFIFSRK